MAGRPPKPSALKLVEGNRGKRAINKQEPDPDYLDNLDPPKWLAGIPGVADVWHELAKDLRDARLLTKVDVTALSQLCVSIAQYRNAACRTGEDLVRAKTVLDEEGSPVQAGEHINPWMLVQSMSFKQANVLMQQFGMTPAARTRVAINPQGELFGNSGSGGPASSGPARFFK